MPRYSAVLEVEFFSTDDGDAVEHAAAIARGEEFSLSGHVTPHTVRLAEEPACDHCDDTGFIAGDSCGWCKDVAYTSNGGPR